MKEQYLECGKIVGTHGINGTLRVNPICDSAEFLTGFKTFYLSRNPSENQKESEILNAVSVKAHKNIALITVKGITNIEEAEKLRGKIIYINRNDIKLKKGQFFINDLLGCKVLNKNGKELGVLTDVSATGANDVWHIKQSGTEYLVPYIKDIEADVDIDNGVITINPLKGIFEDED